MLIFFLLLIVLVEVVELNNGTFTDSLENVSLTMGRLDVMTSIKYFGDGVTCVYKINKEKIRICEKNIFGGRICKIFHDKIDLAAEWRGKSHEKEKSYNKSKYNIFFCPRNGRPDQTLCCNYTAKKMGCCSYIKLLFSSNQNRIIFIIFPGAVFILISLCIFTSNFFFIYI